MEEEALPGKKPLSSSKTNQIEPESEEEQGGFNIQELLNQFKKVRKSHLAQAKRITSIQKPLWNTQV